jgi:hypothetical protein
MVRPGWYKSVEKAQSAVPVIRATPWKLLIFITAIAKVQAIPQLAG